MAWRFSCPTGRAWAGSRRAHLPLRWEESTSMRRWWWKSEWPDITAPARRPARIRSLPFLHLRAPARLPWRSTGHWANSSAPVPPFDSTSPRTLSSSPLPCTCPSSRPSVQGEAPRSTWTRGLRSASTCSFLPILSFASEYPPAVGPSSPGTSLPAYPFSSIPTWTLSVFGSKPTSPGFPSRSVQT